MKLLNTKDLIIKLTDSKLQIIESATLKEKHVIRKPIPKSIALYNPNTLLYGQQDGTLIHFCLKTFESKKLYKNSSTSTSLFTLDNFIYAGYSDGTIIKFKYSPVHVTVFKTYSHNLPILNIISNGEHILVSDLSGKVTSYPSLVVYDMIDPLLIFKYYIFMSEKNVLYCLTRTSVSSYIQTETNIKKYTFSKNGGVVFIMLYDSILVYDFNNKFVIKELSKSYVDFVYDEERNRIVGFYDKGKDVINGILDDVYDEMDNIVFKENKIVEKVVKINEDEEYNYKNNDEYYEDEYYEDDYEDESYEEKKRPKKSTGLKSLFDSEKNDKIVTKFRRKIVDEDSEDSIKPLCNDNGKPLCKNTINPLCNITGVFPIINNNDKLLFYTDIGYLVSISGPESNKIELRYHDRSKQIIEINDYNTCHMGTFYNENILICNKTTVYFYGLYNWTKDINKNNTVVAVSDKYVVISNGLTVVYNSKGDEIFNFNINNITYILISGDYIFVFANNLTVINLFLNTEEYSLPGCATWASYYNNRLYYRIDSEIYILYKKLSHRIFQDVLYPLAVVGNRLVYMDSTFKILPVPTIEFKDLPYSISEYRSIECRESFKSNKENIKDSISDEGRIFDDSNESNSKKINICKD